MWYSCEIEFIVDIFSFSLASLESIVERIEERAPVAKENPRTPMIIKTIQTSLSPTLIATISP